MKSPISLPIVGYILKGARHDRLMISMVMMIVIAVALSFFLGSSALVEKEAFALIYIANTLRVLGVFGLVMFIIFFFRRALDNRDVDYLLSRPIGRVPFVLSHLVAFIILAFSLSLVIFAPVLYLARDFITQAYFVWWAGVLCELIMMAGVALFFSLILRSAASAGFACLGFYALSRLMGQIMGILVLKGDVDATGGLLTGIMKAVSLFIPRLDLLTQSSWLLYGLDGQVGLAFIFIQSAVFMLLIVSAMIIDFIRKQF